MRVAAATLSGAPLGQVTATTVVGVLGQDDVPEFEALVAAIAAEFELEGHIRMHVGSFSVRFRRSRSKLSWHVMVSKSDGRPSADEMLDPVRRQAGVGRPQGVRRALHVVEIRQVTSDRLHGQVVLSDNQPDQPIRTRYSRSLNNRHAPLLTMENRFGL